MSGLKKEGPFGNPQGTEFDFDKNHPPKSLASFQVWTRNDEISAISFTYKDESGAETTRGPFGQTAGAKKFDEVKLQVGEVVTKLTGTFTAERITSLTVTTNIAAAGYGPFGQPSGSGFQTIHPKIVAFFGWCTQDISVNAIGTYYLPN